MPPVPESLRKDRIAVAKRKKEDAERAIRLWSKAKIQALGQLVSTLSSRQVPHSTFEKLFKLQATAERWATGSESGPVYERMADAGEAFLAAYNKCVPKEQRRSVRSVLYHQFHPDGRKIGSKPVPPKPKPKPKPRPVAKKTPPPAVAPDIWTAAKIRHVGKLVHAMKQGMDTKVRLYRMQSGVERVATKKTKGVDYYRMKVAAEKFLAAYNALVPKGDRKTVRDL